MSLSPRPGLKAASCPSSGTHSGDPGVGLCSSAGHCPPGGSETSPWEDCPWTERVLPHHGYGREWTHSLQWWAEISVLVPTVPCSCPLCGLCPSLGLSSPLGMGGAVFGAPHPPVLGCQDPHCNLGGVGSSRVSPTSSCTPTVKRLGWAGMRKVLLVTSSWGAPECFKGPQNWEQNAIP